MKIETHRKKRPAFNAYSVTLSVYDARDHQLLLAMSGASFLLPDLLVRDGVIKEEDANYLGSLMSRLHHALVDAV